MQFAIFYDLQGASFCPVPKHVSKMYAVFSDKQGSIISGQVFEYQTLTSSTHKVSTSLIKNSLRILAWVKNKVNVSCEDEAQRVINKILLYILVADN